MVIAPHGGKLVSCLVSPERERELKKEFAQKPGITLDAVAVADLEMLGVGGYSPLSGFLGKADCARVAAEMRLANGTVWSIPITLGVPKADAGKYKTGARVPLVDEAGALRGVITVDEVFERDVRAECKLVFKTDEDKHPGVAMQLARGPFTVAGKVEVLRDPETPEFAEHRLTPAEARAEFDKRGWKRVVGFQTRNPIHRAHEYIIKCALEICDGLFLHPLVGFTKGDDIPADVRMRCYGALIDNVMQKERVRLAVLPAPMRYAGPREAVQHALVRKNYGCSHFIVGRDHAGVGNYYGTYDAQLIFDTLPAADVGIEPLRFEHSFFCKKCGQMATPKTCPHPGSEHVVLSGTKVRELLRAGERPPVEFSRPEVADILIAWAKNA
jgi:sulfate adenylyltransferase